MKLSRKEMRKEMAGEWFHKYGQPTKAPSKLHSSRTLGGESTIGIDRKKGIFRQKYFSDDEFKK